MRIGVVAGEVSGDLLGADLIAQLKAQCPDQQVHIEGIAGPGMIAQGAHSLFPMERLSVMGFSEVLGRYFELSSIRRKLIRHFIENPPDVFIGIDAPDFNFYLEQRLRKAGIKTVHYVSPTVWAWRQYRVKKIAKAVDLILTLFPFEPDFYKEHQVQARFVGHPLADMIDLEPDQAAARRSLNIPLHEKIVALLPGSRSAEVQRLGEDFIATAALCYQHASDLHFVAPMANDKRRQQFTRMLQDSNVDLPLTLVDGHSREVMAAADVVLLASGTAAQEAMLLKKPTVVAYKLSDFSFWLARKLIKLKYYAMPNILAGRQVMPEFIQDDVQPEAMAKKILEFFHDREYREAIAKEFLNIQKQLRCNAGSQAAEAVLALVQEGKAK